jgi:outer membrane autotransporter protein
MAADVPFPDNGEISEAHDYKSGGDASFKWVDLTNQSTASMKADGSITGDSRGSGNSVIDLDSRADLTIKASGGSIRLSADRCASPNDYWRYPSISVRNASLKIIADQNNALNLESNLYTDQSAKVSIESLEGNNEITTSWMEAYSGAALKISAGKNNVFIPTLSQENITVSGGDLEMTAKMSNIFKNRTGFGCGGSYGRQENVVISAGINNEFTGETSFIDATGGNILLDAKGSNILKGRLIAQVSLYRQALVGSIRLNAGDSNKIGSIMAAVVQKEKEAGTVWINAGKLNEAGGGGQPGLALMNESKVKLLMTAPINRLKGNAFALFSTGDSSSLSFSAKERNEITAGKAGVLFLPLYSQEWHLDFSSESATQSVMQILDGDRTFVRYLPSSWYYSLREGSTDVRLEAVQSNVITANGSNKSVGIGLASNADVEMKAGEENRIRSSGNGAVVRAIAASDDVPDDDETRVHTDRTSLTMTSQTGVNAVEGNENGIELIAQRQVDLHSMENNYYATQARDNSYPLSHSALAKAELRTETGRNSIVSQGNALTVRSEKKGYVRSGWGNDDPDQRVLSTEELNGADIVYGIFERTGPGDYDYTIRIFPTAATELGDASAKSVISAQSGTNEIIGGKKAISAEGYGTGDESAASVTVSTVSGRNVISGGTAALSAGTNGRILVEGSSTVTGAVEAEGEAASIELDYGAGSAVTGNLSAKSGASVAFAPQDGGSLVLTGRAETDADAATKLALNLSADSLWYMTASSNVTSLSGSGTVVYKNGGDALEIETLTGSHTFAMDLSTDGSKSDMLYIVNGTSEKQTLSIKNGLSLAQGMALGDAVRFATIKNAGGGFGNGTELAYADGPVNYIVTVDYRDAESDPLNTEAYNDAYNGDGTRKPTTEQVEATYGGEGSSNVYVVKTAEEENAGGRTAAAAGKLVWRYTTDMDTYTRRMAQSTEFMPGSETGAWLRAAYHRQKADGAGTLHGPFWELGFSGDVSSTAERTHRVGFSAGYTVQSGSWAHDDGSLRVKDATAAFYYTMLGAQDDTGASVSYWDNVLRYHHLRTHTGTYDEPSGANFDGNRTQEAVSLSTEYGRRIALTETVTLTPQAQFQLTYVGGFDSTDSEGMRTEAGHDWSAVARIGADLSRHWGEDGKSSAYLKASLLHEFSDGQEIRVSGRSAASNFEHPGSARGSWAALGLGINRRLGDQAYVYFDGETQIGSGRQNSYVFTGGFKYAF